MWADAQALKGRLGALLLASLAGGPRHGYALKEALRRRAGDRFGLPAGTIYPALRRLEAAGLIHRRVGRGGRGAAGSAS
jgi:PadR family transcriptional regulator, regulatory protein PadR